MSPVQKILKEMLKDKINKEPDSAKLDQWMIEQLGKDIRAGKITAKNPQWVIDADILDKFFVETEAIPILKSLEKLGFIKNLKYDLDKDIFKWTEIPQSDWEKIQERILKEMPTQGTG